MLLQRLSTVQNRHCQSLASSANSTVRIVSSFLLLPRSPPTVLLLKRSADRRLYPSLWAACSGNIEPQDNSPRAAALREIWEEVKIPEAILEETGSGRWTIGDGGKRWDLWAFAWRMKVTDEDEARKMMKLNAENVEARFVPLAQMSSLATVPDLELRLRALLGSTDRAESSAKELSVPDSSS